MRTWIMRALILGGAMLAASACATSEEWADWQKHPTHFASGDHAMFSFRNNKEGSSARVTRTDIEAARAQQWWGKVITVSPEQIIQQ